MLLQHGVSTIERAQKYADDGKMAEFELKSWELQRAYRPPGGALQ